MKKIIFDMNPLGSFSISNEAYIRYYEKKFEKKIYFYTRRKGKYIRIDNLEDIKSLKNRVITLIDLGMEVDEIPFSDNVRVCPIDDSYENDEVLKSIILELGDRASWKNSKLQLIEVSDDF